MSYTLWSVAYDTISKHQFGFLRGQFALIDYERECNKAGKHPFRQKLLMHNVHSKMRILIKSA